MSDIAIKVENLSKLYKIGAIRNRHDTLRDHLMYSLKSLFSRKGHRAIGSDESSLSDSSSNGQPPDDHIWALKNVSFEIKEGEVVGFIGRNGAGKSTLLKILSGITEPTTGRVKITGRVGSLLEVGTGFHPELTGRENLYLNGAILGMKRWEIQKKFDEIVDFAGIEKFIDTPVKHYSSGMYVRLAFAVASHLEPEILICDEVLAVGDAAFRLKCMDKMQQIRESGRTILLVSHAMEAITRMCDQAVLLESGQVVGYGFPHDVIPNYLQTVRHVGAEKEWSDPQLAPGDDVVRLRKVRVRSESGDTVVAHDIRRPIGIEVDYEVLTSGHILVPNYHFHNAEGLLIFMAHDFQSEWRRKPRPLGEYTSTVWIPGNFLAEGQVVVSAAVCSYVPSTAVHCFERQVVAFQVIDSHDGDSARGDYTGPYPGVVRPVLKWMTTFKSCEGKSDKSLKNVMRELSGEEG